jgi:hydroperoxide dehydratase
LVAYEQNSMVSCHVAGMEAATRVTTASQLPLQNIPGTYGVPYFGAIKDRLDFFWFQGIETFFKSRVEKYNSTVFRVNMPPGPPGFPDPRVITLLDQKSFPTLFDIDRVEKRDVFVGTYMPRFTSIFKFEKWIHCLTYCLGFNKTYK